MTSNTRLLCVFASIILFGGGTLAFKSGCSGGYCFIISDYNNSNERLNQSDAQECCRSNGSQLLEIVNKDIQDSLVNVIRSVYSQGLNRWNVLTNGRLSSSSHWSRLSGRDIGEITVNDDTDSSFVYGYLGLTTSGFDLFASRGTYNKGFICEGLSDCSDGTMIDGQCYKTFSETLPWYDARNRCLSKGGDIASFDNITTNIEFKALNGSWLNASTSYWIGIRKESWTWQHSDADVKYTEWLSGHPRNYLDCLCLSKTEWKWTECNCSQPLPFICMTEHSTQFSTAMTSQTTASGSNDRSTIAAIVTDTTFNESLNAAYESSNLVADDAESTEQSKYQNTGLAVGLGVGIPALIIIVLLTVATVVSMRRRRQALSSTGSFRSNTTLKSNIQETDSVDRSGFTKDPCGVFQSDKENTTHHHDLNQTLDNAVKTDLDIV